MKSTKMTSRIDGAECDRRRYHKHSGAQPRYGPKSFLTHLPPSKEPHRARQSKRAPRPAALDVVASRHESQRSRPRTNPFRRSQREVCKPFSRSSFGRQVHECKGPTRTPFLAAGAQQERAHCVAYKKEEMRAAANVRALEERFVLGWHALMGGHHPRCTRHMPPPAMARDG